MVSNHWLTLVVLPKPAGAETSVSRRPAARPSFNFSTRRARPTGFVSGAGLWSFVASKLEITSRVRIETAAKGIG